MPNLEADLSPTCRSNQRGRHDQCKQYNQYDKCKWLTKKVKIDAADMTNGGDYSSGSNHDKIDVSVGGKEHGLYYWDRHRHVGKVRHGVTE